MEAPTGESILLPAISAPSCISSLRSLGRRGIHTVAASEHESAPVFRSKYCDEAVLIPSPADDFEGYRDALFSLASREDVRTIIPMREEEAYVLSRYRSRFAEHVAPLWPSFETLRTVHDRVDLVEAAKQAGVSVPETHRLNDVDEWSHRQIVKARYSLLTDDYVDSPEKFGEAGTTTYLRPGTEPDCETIRAEMGHEPIVQEYIPGGEYALWALYDHGEPVATCQKRQHRAYKYPGGTSIYRAAAKIPELEEAGRALLDHLDWHGLASVQFIRDERTGEFKLNEINPRAWLSLPCSVQAGADFPYYYWRTAGGEPIDEDTDYEAGFATHLLRGEAVYLHSVLEEDNPFVDPPSFGTALWEVASSLYTQPHFDYLSLDDPAPFLQDVRNAVSDFGRPGTLPVSVPGFR
jgi:predicted ATP-grasp superfamily ATP-dependent carboligase